MSTALIVGSINYYSTNEIIDGYYVSKTIKEEIKSILKVSEIKGYAFITHTGAYGRKKFILDGVVYTTENGYNRSITRSTLAIATVEGKEICVDFHRVTFNREDWTEMHALFIRAHTKDVNVYWLELIY